MCTINNLKNVPVLNMLRFYLVFSYDIDLIAMCDENNAKCPAI